jgi:2,5-diamino-6-(ribosylamino)-4(3H)-pyrimidinone 5'-phosphate reductase
MRRPRVVVHVAVSADGRIDGFAPDIGRYYELAASFQEDITLAGADTVLAGLAHAGATPAAVPPPQDGPLLAVVDSRGRVGDWRPLLGAGLWRGGLALCAESTPTAYREQVIDDGVTVAVHGTDRVDLTAALEVLAVDHGAHTVRVDSGGRLNGALLRAGLVDEVSLLVHPVVVGGLSAKGAFVADDLETGAEASALDTPRVEAVGEGLLWVRWLVGRPG